MKKPIENESEALKSAIQIIDAQDRLLIAYRIGGRPPGGAIDRLNWERPRFEAWLDGGRES